MTDLSAARMQIAEMGICPLCLHPATDHTSLECRTDCAVCQSILAEVVARWRRGEGNPPPGFVEKFGAVSDTGEGKQ